MLVTRKSYGPEKPKAWSFSYSKLKNFEVCPKKHYHTDFVPKGHKDKVTDTSSQMEWGNAVHASLAQRIEKGTILPPLHQRYERWAERVLQGHANAAAYHAATGATIYCELDLAIAEDFSPTEWFEREALEAGKLPPWLRCKIDLLVLSEDCTVALVRDWKTGKPKDDAAQLALNAATVFYHYPKVVAVGSMFSWLEHDEDSSLLMTRDDLPAMWAEILPRVNELRAAHELMNFPPTPGPLCRYCPVKQCPHCAK